MTSEQYWAELRALGFTQMRVLSAGDKRRVILQSRDRDFFPSITHPDDLTPEQRRAEMDKFLSMHML